MRQNEKARLTPCQAGYFLLSTLAPHVCRCSHRSLFRRCPSSKRGRGEPRPRGRRRHLVPLSGLAQTARRLNPLRYLMIPWASRRALIDPLAHLPTCPPANKQDTAQALLRYFPCSEAAPSNPPYRLQTSRRHREHDRVASHLAGRCRKDQSGSLPGREYRTC